MRLSFETTILLCFVTLVFSGSSVTDAQTPAMVVGESDVEYVASPFASWQPLPVENSVSVASDGTESTIVVLEVATFTVDLNSDVPLKSFFKPGSFEVHTGSMPGVSAAGDLGTSRLSSIGNSTDSPTKSATGFESVRRSMPVMLAKLDDRGILKMKAALPRDATQSSPTMTCYSGQTATVSDMNLRPFVVGVKPIVGDSSVAHEPIIQTIEDGYMLRLNPVIVEGKIKLDANMAHSQVSNVETFTFSKTGDGGVTVQIPEQTLKQVHVSTALEDGETLFIDPRLQVEVKEEQTAKHRFAKAKTTSVSKQVYFSVTAHIVVQKEELVTSLTRNR